MASVVNVNAITARFATLGWTTISISDVVTGLQQASIGAVELIAYLDALIATPGGMNDQAVTGCTATDATKITAFLKGRGAVAI